MTASRRYDMGMFEQLLRLFLSTVIMLLLGALGIATAALPSVPVGSTAVATLPRSAVRRRK